jgi:ribosomal protein L20A (L18A)
MRGDSETVIVEIGASHHLKRTNIRIVMTAVIETASVTRRLS